MSPWGLELLENSGQSITSCLLSLILLIAVTDVFSPVKQLSSGHQLQNQSDVCVRLKDLL